MTELARSAAAEPAPLGYSDVFKTQAERRAELRRMRAIATMLLVLMAAIYLAMRRAPPNWAWAPYLGAFAEAGMVGACADWFAVVALFRRPLGLPIPHTAVVPENKRRIGAAMGRFITNNFLSPRVAIARLASVDFVGLAARWLEDERNARAVASAVGRAIPYALDLVPKAEIDEWVAFAARRGIEAVPAAPLASRGLSILWARGAGQTLLDQALDFLETTLDQHKATIVRHVSQRTWRWIPKWVDDMIAAKVVNGLAGTLKEMRDPDHPWREQANALVEKLIDKLAHDPEMRAQGEALKQDILANPVFAEQARAMGRAGDGAEGRSASPPRSDCPVARGLGRRARPMAGRGRPASGEDQSEVETLGAAHGPAPSGRNRGLHRRGGRQLGHRHPRQPLGTSGRQGPPIYPHQRHAGRRAGRAPDLHPVARVWRLMLRLVALQPPGPRSRETSSQPRRSCRARRRASLARRRDCLAGSLRTWRASGAIPP
jgi:uncharacterized membrane-anchored protein YjiN (DUF445 family)